MARVNYDPIYANSEDKLIKGVRLYLKEVGNPDDDIVLYADAECTKGITMAEARDLMRKSLAYVEYEADGVLLGLMPAVYYTERDGYGEMYFANVTKTPSEETVFAPVKAYTIEWDD